MLVENGGEERNGMECRFKTKGSKVMRCKRAQDACYPESHRTDVFVLQSMSLEKSSGHRSKKCSKYKNA